MTAPDSNSSQDNSVIWPELWSKFESHRNRILQILQSVAPDPGGSLCVWGAGRTTDLDLIQLLKHYRQIDLVDCEPQLTCDALVQRGFDQHQNVSVHQATDLTGLESFWDERKNSNQPIDIHQFNQLAANATLDLPRYDVIISTCVLSQIIRTATHLIFSTGGDVEESRTTMANAIRTLREQHIRLLLDHLNPGGYGILVTDMTSSESMPEILEPDADAGEIMNKVVAGNHFHGLNPQLITESTAREGIHEKLESLAVSAPWVWDSLEMQYLCIAFQLKRKS